VGHGRVKTLTGLPPTTPDVVIGMTTLTQRRSSIITKLCTATTRQIHSTDGAASRHITGSKNGAGSASATAAADCLLRIVSCDTPLQGRGGSGAPTGRQHKVQHDPYDTQQCVQEPKLLEVDKLLRSTKTTHPGSSAAGARRCKSTL
jgi:hypothetical protein